LILRVSRSIGAFIPAHSRSPRELLRAVVDDGDFGERIAQLALLVFLLVGVGAFLMVPLMVAREGLAAFFGGSGFWGLFVIDPWEPLSSPASYGLRHAWLSTIIVTFIAVVLAAPVGFGIGVFMSEVAPERLRRLLQPALELLAGIPSVVYGFFGYVTLVPWFERFFEMPAGESLLVAGLILAVMILPFIATTSGEAFRAVPRDMKQAALALGINRWKLVTGMLFPASAGGMIAAVVLGVGRALGETLAVLMLAGNSVAPPESLLDRGQPITALIVTELGEAGAGSPKYHALFAAALLLMLVIIAINALIGLIKQRVIRGVS
jgi:phosphate ABC transporter permease protein PstC